MNDNLMREIIKLVKQLPQNELRPLENAISNHRYKIEREKREEIETLLSD